METAVKGNAKIIKEIEVDKYEARIYYEEGKETYIVWNNENDSVEWEVVLDIVEYPFESSVSYDKWIKNKNTIRDAEEEYGVNFDNPNLYY